MKTAIEIIAPGTEVYALNEYHTGESESVDRGFVQICKAVVNTVYYSLDDKTGLLKLEYWLRTLEGEDWGDAVPAKNISEDGEDLLEILRKEWLS